MMNGNLVDRITVTQYTDQIVLFADVLGFKEFIQRTLHEPTLIGRWQTLQSQIRQQISGSGRTNPSLRISTFSDSLCISSEFYPESFHNFLSGISFFSMAMLSMGFPLRGGIVRGQLHHEQDGMVLGPALIDAYELEQSAIYPRILIGESIPETGDADFTKFQMTLVDFDGWRIVNLFNPLAIAFMHLISDKSPSQIASETRSELSKRASTSTFPKVRAKYHWLMSHFDAVHKPDTDYSAAVTFLVASMREAALT